jgi:hypothetical protein
LVEARLAFQQLVSEGPQGGVRAVAGSKSQEGQPRAVGDYVARGPTATLTRLLLPLLLSPLLLRLLLLLLLLPREGTRCDAIHAARPRPAFPAAAAGPDAVGGRSGGMHRHHGAVRAAPQGSLQPNFGDMWRSQRGCEAPRGRVSRRGQV